MGTMTVAAVQLPGCTDDESANLAAAEAGLREAAAAGAALAVLPELATVPYFAGAPAGSYRDWAQPVTGELVHRIRTVATDLGLHVVLPFFEIDPDAGTYHNSAVVLNGNGIIPALDRSGRSHPVARKLHLPVGAEPAPGFDEPAHFTAGDWLGTHRIGDLGVGTLVCYDRRFPECWRELRSLGADLVAVPVAGSGGDTVDFFLGELCTHAKENGVFAVVANKVGTEWVDGHAIDNYGSSCIVGPDGTVLAHRPRVDGPGIVVADIDLAVLHETRSRNRYFDHRRLDLFPGPVPADLLEIQ
jgi:predicted amidohydrolase